MHSGSDSCADTMKPGTRNKQPKDDAKGVIYVVAAVDAPIDEEKSTEYAGDSTDDV